MTYGEAIRLALEEEMRRDASLFIMGEDIEQGAGNLLGLKDAFGEERVFDTPISEAAVIGMAVGAACTGCRVIVSLAIFGEFIIMGMDQIYNQAAKLRYMFGGKPRVPMVIRAGMGGYIGAAEHHSQCLESWFAHAPGLIVVAPSTPRDGKGLLKTAIRNDNPVMFFEHKLLYGIKGEVSEGDYLVPFGQADVKRKGKDVTVIAYSYMVHKALAVAERLAPELSVEVVDVRTLSPLDEETILGSVEKTHRAVIVHEAWTQGGFGGEIAARIADRAFYSLDAPIKRVGAKHFPIPFAPELENYILPQEKDIENAVREVTGRRQSP